MVSMCLPLPDSCFPFTGSAVEWGDPRSLYQMLSSQVTEKKQRRGLWVPVDYSIDQRIQLLTFMVARNVLVRMPGEISKARGWLNTFSSDQRVALHHLVWFLAVLRGSDLCQPGDRAVPL